MRTPTEMSVSSLTSRKIPIIDPANPTIPENAGPHAVLSFLVEASQGWMATMLCVAPSQVQNVVLANKCHMESETFWTFLRHESQKHQPCLPRANLWLAS
jgi:hypothetical protein